MGIQRNPHPVFSVLWGVWGLATIYLFATGPTLTPWAMWFVYFLAVELTGVFYKGPNQERDTLSETMTYLQRSFSQHRRFGRGWNAALLAIVLMVSWVGVYPVPNDFQRAVMGILVAVWLYDHWMSPDIHG